jgi:hypothetical protein
MFNAQVTNNYPCNARVYCSTFSATLRNQLMISRAHCNHTSLIIQTEHAYRMDKTLRTRQDGLHQCALCKGQDNMAKCRKKIKFLKTSILFTLELDEPLSSTLYKPDKVA